MFEVITLGTAGALPNATRENTYLAVRGPSGVILVDCAGSPIQRLQRMGIEPAQLDGLIVTHHHPDHIYGLPLLILGMWLLGRTQSLNIFGPLKAVSTAAALMDILDSRDWPGLFSTVFHQVQLTENYPVTETKDFVVTATPVAHLVACTALRFECKHSGRSLVYSADTEPCTSLVRLGYGADLLLHEATGPEKGHSTPAQAGAMAREMRARRLVLVHLSAQNGQRDAWQAEAEQEYGQPVEIAEDYDQFQV